MSACLRLLLAGRPGVGKTTVVRRLAELLRARGAVLAGFTTEEIRVRRRRVGFSVESLAGDQGILAHIDFPGPPRVGKYGVDLAALERLALPALEAPAGAVVVVDELGKMELASAAFREGIAAVFAAGVHVVATVHVFRHPFTDALKARRDVEVLGVTEANRANLPEQLADRLAL